MSTAERLVLFRGLLLFLSMQGMTKQALAVQALVDAIEAGREVDEHMAEVAEAFKTGSPPSWDDIIDRVRSATDSFLSAPNPAPG